MGIVEVLEDMGRIVESFFSFLVCLVHPTPNKKPSTFKFLSKLVKNNKITLHELLSLKLQISLLTYLVLSLSIILMSLSPWLLVLLGVLYIAYVRCLVISNWNYFIEPEPYRIFYYSIFLVSFGAFIGYTLLKLFRVPLYILYLYLLLIFVVVLGFRQYFKTNYGRDWTYGEVIEVGNGVVRVFVHDDIRANAKPGYYWVEGKNVEVGSIVKVQVRDRNLKGSIPIRIVSNQSSQTSEEPKTERE